MKKETCENIQAEIQSIGIDISILNSLVNFLDLANNGDFELRRCDIENLISVIKNLVVNIKNKHDALEKSLDI